jgi:hypothetical protein
VLCVEDAFVGRKQKRKIPRPVYFAVVGSTSKQSQWATALARYPLRGGKTMRFMVMIKASQESEAGVMPSEELLTAMGQYNEELVQAGVLQAGEGLQPSAKGARVKFSGSQRTVIDGPFSETKELIAGFWIFQVKSLQEAIEWVKRCPNPMPGESEIEIRQVFEAEDFGAEFTPELRQQEESVRAQLSNKA